MDLNSRRLYPRPTKLVDRRLTAAARLTVTHSILPIDKSAPLA